MALFTDKKLMVSWTFAVLLAGWLFQGCATVEPGRLDEEAEKGSLVLGFLRVEPTGPIFRLHQEEPHIRFLDVKNTQTGEWTRIPISEKATRFVTTLSPGQYEIFRIQLGEGPFRSESYVNLNFEVLPDKTMYVGIWRMQVDAPKTVRMLQLDVLDELPDWDLLVTLHPELDEKALAVSLPQPTTNQSRLFAVAPSQPRSKYFYRR